VAAQLPERGADCAMTGKPLDEGRKNALEVTKGTGAGSHQSESETFVKAENPPSWS